MGMFSFESKVSGKPTNSDYFTGDYCRLYLLVNGKCIEEMRGAYNGYGVCKDVDGKDQEWATPWDVVARLITDDNQSNGIAMILEDEYTGEVFTTQSEQDGDQGFGRILGGKYVAGCHLVFDK